MKQPLHERLMPMWTFGAGMMAVNFDEKWRSRVGTIGLFIVIVSGLLMFVSLVTSKRSRDRRFNE